MRRRASRSRGASLVEFALTAGIVLTVMFAAMALSQALSTYHFLASAASQATRYAIVRGAECSSWSSACPASAGDIQSYVRGLVPDGITAANVNVTTTWLPDNQPGSFVKVTVAYSFNLEIPFIPAQSLPLSSTAEMTISQ